MVQITLMLKFPFRRGPIRVQLLDHARVRFFFGLSRGIYWTKNIKPRGISHGRGRTSIGNDSYHLTQIPDGKIDCTKRVGLIRKFS